VKNKQVSFLDMPVCNDQEIIPTCKPNTNSKNAWHMPSALDLDSSGLRRSSRTEVLKRRDKVYSHTTQVNQDFSLQSAGKSLQSAGKRCFKTALVLFSSICSVGCGLTSMAHSLQAQDTVTSSTQSSVFSKAVESYHRVNSLYNGTINCYTTLAQASVASNKPTITSQVIGS
jgi:hypothetical protein